MIVLYGATGYTGRLCAQYMQKQGESFAIAGRNENKLKQIHKEMGLGDETRIIVADCADQEAIDSLVKQATCVLTTVGPYRKYSSFLLESCARQGTHYVDLTGESLWIKQQLDAGRHELAERTGAKIVFSCGFDSVFADLGAWMMVDHFQREFGKVPKTVKFIFTDLGSGFASGGTSASFLDVVEQVWDNGLQLVRDLDDPFLLASVPGVSSKGSGKPMRAFAYDSDISGFTFPWLLAGHDIKAVYRTGSLLGGIYKDMHFKEAMHVNGAFGGLFPALATTFMVPLLGLLGVIPFTRRLLARMLPKPGEGMTEEQRLRGYAHANTFAYGDGGEVACGLVGTDLGDAGYTETAKMLCESARCLAHENDELEYKKGGLLTPAAAMGGHLLRRLRAQGMVWQVSSKERLSWPVVEKKTD